MATLEIERQRENYGFTQSYAVVVSPNRQALACIIILDLRLTMWLPQNALPRCVSLGLI